MATQGHGNFAFMYDIDREFYKDLLKIERYARIDILITGNPLRQALEKFISVVIHKYNLSAHLSQCPSLWEKIDRLQLPQTLQYAKLMNPNTAIPQNHLLPFCNEKVAYSAEGATEAVEDFAYYYLRVCGNAFSHKEERVGEPRKTYKNLVRALAQLHKILKAFYNVPNIPKFDENKMPIAEFIVDSHRAPEDKNSKCATEFYAHSVNRDGNPEFYALLRLYRRSNLDVNFMLRNQECFALASQESESGLPDGMTRMRELTPRDSDNEFYIIAYIFSRKAHVLSDELLAQMDMPQRLHLCKRLARGLTFLHGTENPIYHRLLTYDCIYVSQHKQSWIPYIVKFDYAKIDAKTRSSIVTVRPQAKAATQKQMEEDIKARYIPREWPEKENENPNVDWAKVDIYSLGVLMGDILTGKFSSHSIQAILMGLQRQRLSPKLIEILALMTGDSPADRCSMEDVLAVFEQEVR